MEKRDERKSIATAIKTSENVCNKVNSLFPLGFLLKFAIKLDARITGDFYRTVTLVLPSP